MNIEIAMKMQLPWADKIVNGDFPILIRKNNTHNRGVIGVQCTQTFDRFMINEHNPFDYSGYYRKIIGAIEIYDVKKVKKSEIFNKLTTDVNKNFSKFYPRQFIPQEKEVYFWYLKKPVKFNNFFPVSKRGGILWTRLTSEEGKKLRNWK